MTGRNVGIVRVLCMVALTMVAIASPLANIGAQSTLVVLVRHAEKAAVPGNDPPISEIGQARAQALAHALSGANVTAVITSTLRRTSETAQPLMQARSLTPELISLEGGTPAHVNAVAAAVRKHVGEVVLVVGHSNTIPAIIAALGGPKLPDICDAMYSSLFVLEIGAASGGARLVRSQFGAADVGTDACPGMQVK